MLLNGKAPLPGEVIKLPNLARTFREVVMHGKDGFYKGRVAQAIVDLIQSKGGVMELSDLENHETNFVEPIKYTYMDEITVYEVCIIIKFADSDRKLILKASARRTDKVNILYMFEDPVNHIVCRHYYFNRTWHIGQLTRTGHS